MTAKLGSDHRIIQDYQSSNPMHFGVQICVAIPIGVPIGCWSFVGGIVFKGMTTDPLSQHFCKAELVNATGRWSKTGQTHLFYKTFDCSCCHLLLWFSALLSFFILCWRSFLIDCLAGTILHESSLAPLSTAASMPLSCRCGATFRTVHTGGRRSHGCMGIQRSWNIEIGFQRIHWT